MSRRSPESQAMLDSARAYAYRGWLVIPVHSIEDGRCTCGDGPACTSPGKHPRTQHGLKEASSDLATVEKWWRRWPDANVAIVTGAASGLVVLDIDGYHGGDDTLAELVAENGPLPSTLQVITGGDGMHYLFAHPGEEIRNTAGKKLGQGLDVRGDGGYIVAAPSLHVSGKRYEWVDVDVAPAPLPGWMLDKLRKPTGVTSPPKILAPISPPAAGGTPYGLEALARELADVRAAGQGGRNAQLNESAFVLGQLVAGGELEEALVVAELTAAAAAVGLGEGEIAKTIASGMGGGKERPRTAPERPDRPTTPRPRAWEPPPGDEDAPPPEDESSGADEGPPGPPPDDDAPIGPGGYRQSDRGNARRLVHGHGRDLRYCPRPAMWLVWDGHRWAEDETGEVYRRAKRTVEGMLDELVRLPIDQRKGLFKFILASEGMGRIESMVRCAETEPEMPVRHVQLDADPWLLNVANGTIDLRTGELRPHRRQDLLTKMAPVDYDPEALAPTFTAFLNRIMGGDEDLTGFVQRAVGYALSGSVAEQVLFFLHGKGQNGKTTLLEVLMGILGDYAVKVEAGLLVASKVERHPTGVADLMGRRFAVSEEVDEGQRLDEPLVKQLTGGTSMKARRMRENFFEFAATHKLFLAANHRPVVRGTDKAIWRRLRLIPFDVTIPEDERDRELPAKLLAEAPGILAWAVRGCLEWQRQGLGYPKRVAAATDEYRSDMDTLGQFLDERCEIGPEFVVAGRALYQAYESWAREANEFVHNQRRFGSQLRERGFERIQVGRTKIWSWRGLRPRPNAALVPEEGEMAALFPNEPENGPRWAAGDENAEARPIAAHRGPNPVDPAYTPAHAGSYGNTGRMGRDGPRPDAGPDDGSVEEMF